MEQEAMALSLAYLTLICLNLTSGKGYHDNSIVNEMTDEQRLLDRLMSNYDRFTRPVFNASHSVHVQLGITLNQIFDVIEALLSSSVQKLFEYSKNFLHVRDNTCIKTKNLKQVGELHLADERNQVMTTHIWLDQEWADEKMKWRPEDYNGLRTLRVPCHLIWKPDIILYNSADDYRDYMSSLAMVSFDGRIFWPPIVRARSTCRIDITFFPFDDQICWLKFGSWAYDGLQVDLLKREHPIDISKYVDNGEWKLIDVKIERNVEQYSCCHEPYPDITFTLHISRGTLYYTYNVLVPCLMLSCLTLLGFWMPPEGGEKVTLGLTILLAFSVFMLLIAENMPATSFYIPLIGAYIIVAMGITSCSVLCAVVVSHLHYKGRMGDKVPALVLSMAACLDRVVKVRRPSKRHSDTASAATSSSECLTHYNVNASNCGGNEDDSYNEVEPRRTRSKRKQSLERRMIISLEEISRKLDTLLDKERLQEVDKSPSLTWQEVAAILDRTLFLLFVFVTSLFTVVILVFVPFRKTVHLS